ATRSASQSTPVATFCFATLHRSLDPLAVQRYIQTLSFLLFGDAQTSGHVDDFQNDEAGCEAVDQRGAHTPQLGEDRSVGAADFLAGEDPREQSTDDAADTMHPERVERIVIAQRTLQRGRCEEAYDAGNETDDDRGRGSDEARRRRDRDQSCDGAGGDTQETRFALDDPFG